MSKKRKIILFVIALALFLITALYLMLKKSPTSDVPASPSSPLQNIYNLLPTNDQISVIITSPEDNTDNVNLVDVITVEFSPNITDDDHGSITYQLNPTIDTNHSWSTTNILEIFPSRLFKESTRYTLNIFFNSRKIHSLSFSTSSFSDLSPEQEVEIQAKSDYLYRQAILKDLEENPWLDSIPVITDQYTITYDSTTNIIVVNFLNADTNELRTEVANKLKEINAPPEIRIIWKTS